MNILKRYKSVLTPDQKKERRKNLNLCLASGLLLGLSFPPVPAPYLMFGALIPYFIVIDSKKTLGEINRFTYSFAFIFTVISIYWVGGWTSEADTFLMISGAMLMFYNPLMFLIPSTLFYFGKKKFGGKIPFLLFPFFWVSYEYFYSVFELRFPWLTLGHGLSYFKSFIQIADIIGAYGLSLIIIFINVFLFFFYKSYKESKKEFKFLYAAIIFTAVPVIYGQIKIYSFLESEEKIKIGVVQPDLNPNKKWEAGNLNEQINLYFDLSQKAINEDAEIILWPETALPVYLFSGGYSREVKRITEFVDSNKIFLMTGMPDATFYFDTTNVPPEAKPLRGGELFYTSYNSIFLFTSGKSEIQKYGKIKLVPFGEKAPFIDLFPFVGDWIKWNVGISSWNVGKEQTVFNLSINENKIKAGGVICIESVYPEFTAKFVENGAQILFVVTNDSWYGNSSGPYQHKEISVLRAVENRRSLVRAANGGISCFINSLGFTLSESEMFTQTYLTQMVGIKNEMTFYTKYPYLIPYLSWTVSLLVILIFIQLKISLKFIHKKTEK
ncbi:MAG: apolipoprotein N-acyltransferase [Bacteroidetes bacterium]|nr:apolipoprotein N-acyltransferase [Bacteroidota bacterium]